VILTTEELDYILARYGKRKGAAIHDGLRLLMQRDAEPQIFGAADVARWVATSDVLCAALLRTAAIGMLPADYLKHAQGIAQLWDGICLELEQAPDPVEEQQRRLVAEYYPYSGYAGSIEEYRAMLVERYGHASPGAAKQYEQEQQAPDLAATAEAVER
jgi:hypothetical protein